MRKRSLDFRHDDLDWEGGVTEAFINTPLGVLADPLPIEEIAEVEWTIIVDNFVSISPIDPNTQLKLWFFMPDDIRHQIVKYTQEFLPFDRDIVQDRYLLSYTVETPETKVMGFIFESITPASKVPVYVYLQARLPNLEELEPPKYLTEYLEKINQTELGQLVPTVNIPKKEGIFKRIKKKFFG